MADADPINSAPGLAGMGRDTIFARASAPGVAGVQVIRVSGSAAGAGLLQLGPKELPEARKATLCTIKDPATGEPIDHALVIWFPGPASFTGEDVVELHLHGSLAVGRKIMQTLSGLDGFRPADAGEFTRRAFVNGRMDLTQVEGLADLIAAETEAQLKQALAQAGGGLGELYESWRSRLMRARALVEAELDFSDEELPEGIRADAMKRAREIRDEITTHLNDGRRGEMLRNGLRVAIVGAPNAGKSSLVNALAGRDAAIVSHIPGTTRDVVEVHLDLGGYPLLVADTAGLRAAHAPGGSSDEIEIEGMRRARHWAENADIKICMFAAETAPGFDGETISMLGDNAIACISKCDGSSTPPPDNINAHAAIHLSVKTGDGMDALLKNLELRAGEMLGARAGEPVPTRERHRHHLTECAGALTRFIDDEKNMSDELAAEEIRIAAMELGRITGRVDVEHMLDIVFAEFCIGK